MGTENLKRAAWARSALDAFAVKTGQDLKYRPEMLEAIGDLVCDLMHLANQSGIENVEDLSVRAVSMYQAEVNDDE